MGLLNMLPDSNLGMGGEKPKRFGVNPVPPDSLHDEYSTYGTPKVKWRSIGGLSMKPQPSRLDIGDSTDWYDPTYKYSDHKPE